MVVVDWQEMLTWMEWEITCIVKGPGTVMASNSMLDPDMSEEGMQVGCGHGGTGEFGHVKIIDQIKYMENNKSLVSQCKAKEL